MAPPESHTRRAGGGAALTLATALVAGCGAVGDLVNRDEDTTEPPAPLVDFEPEIEVEEVWSRNVGSGVSEHYLKLRPLIEEGRVLAAEREGTVSAYDVVTGEELWEVDLDAPIAGGPGGGEGLVLLGTSEGEVIALDAGSGATSWRARVTSEVLAPPRASDGIVVARTVDGKLFGLSAEDGSRVWVYDRTVPVLTLRGTSTPAIERGTVVAGFDSGRLVALGLSDGALLWETRVAVPHGRSELERMVDIDADPVIADGVVYAVTFQGRVAAVDLATGNVLWRRDMSSHAGVGLDQQSLYVTDDASQVWALDRLNSASVWRQDALRARAVTAPLAYRDWIVVGDFEGYVHWLDRNDGRFVARVRIDGDGVIAPPVSDGERVYVYGRSGDLAALAPR